MYAFLNECYKGSAYHYDKWNTGWNYWIFLLLNSAYLFEIGANILNYKIILIVKIVRKIIVKQMKKYKWKNGGWVGRVQVNRLFLNLKGYNVYYVTLFFKFLPY